jgi:hypothetical protein
VGVEWETPRGGISIDEEEESEMVYHGGVRTELMFCVCIDPKESVSAYDTLL